MIGKEKVRIETNVTLDMMEIRLSETCSTKFRVETMIKNAANLSVHIYLRANGEAHRNNYKNCQSHSGPESFVTIAESEEN